jgi:two-component system LytT family response regulator
VNAVDYLLKPITLEAFLGAANRAYAYAETSRRSTSVPNTTIPEERDVNGFFVKADYKTVRIDYRDIVYAESMSEYMRIHLEGISRPIITLLTMHRLEEILPSDRFLRVHRSYIVNMEKVSEVSRLRIVFGKDTYIPVGEQYKDKFMQFIGRYFVGKE